jgi:hypothetical protein
MLSYVPRQVSGLVCLVLRVWLGTDLRPGFLQGCARLRIYWCFECHRRQSSPRIPTELWSPSQSPPCPQVLPDCFILSRAGLAELVSQGHWYRNNCITLALPTKVTSKSKSTWDLHGPGCGGFGVWALYSFFALASPCLYSG